MPQYMIQRDNFNPRSREGSDNLAARASGLPVISIHAPAKGATFFFLPILAHSSISIHAPAKGATAGRGRAGSRCSDFNPRSREGSDQIISSVKKAKNGFQSTLPRRERLVTGCGIYTEEEFQSTLPRRERRKKMLLTSWETDFNPRSREGSDFVPYPNINDSNISIHAPAKGATC